MKVIYDRSGLNSAFVVNYKLSKNGCVKLRIKNKYPPSFPESIETFIWVID